MKEEDLAMAQALVADAVAAERNYASPGCSPAPIKKTLITQIQNKTKAFR